MISVRAKLKKAVLIVAAAGSFLIVFLIDVIRWSADINGAWLGVTRHLFVIVAFGALYILVELLWKRDQSTVRKLGFILVVALIVGVMSILLGIMSEGSFDAKNQDLLASGFDGILVANLFGVVLGSTMVLVLLTIRDILYARRRQGTRRNFLVLLGVILAASLSSIPYKPLEAYTLGTVLYVLTIIMIGVNSFRLSWIVYLTKREKLFGMVYGFVLLAIFVGYAFVTTGDTEVSHALLFYSRPLAVIIRSVALFGAVYFGMTFVSTLFHLPTAEAFDRKKSEVSSLHNLSRLVTQVFDFNELVETVTKMTLEVCEAKNAWLEIIAQPGSGGSSLAKYVEPHQETEFVTVSLRNISDEATKEILPPGESALRQEIIATRRPVVIDDGSEDPRMAHLRKNKLKIGSMVVVPLLSHDRVVGILYTSKDMAYGFDREDVELISAFADQAAIAIENSRLIEKSLERERLMREMLLAQDMQRKLLPQKVPVHPNFELEALSTPAFEVGGDYYDFLFLDEHHLGLLVGDVSGKGVSAAFYMAEMKGIFQSLSKIYRSPRDFLIKAHEALVATIDKRSFISLIYAVLDVRTGELQIARAGHCPLLHRSGAEVRYVKPTGMGLGMGTNDYFKQTMAEERLALKRNDIIVLYTDGLTEAHPKNGDEYGYDRLRTVVRDSPARTVEEMRDEIIMSVDKHMEHESPEDDLTIVVLRWISPAV
jgi:sigma-B regulation protein RsbU (phosphoserine phosphatase)